jgi:RNA polymerase sigma-70 factor (ECF subfamily)
MSRTEDTLGVSTSVEGGRRGGGVDVEAALAAHGPALFRLARSLTRDHAAAEDLLQETFVRALERGSGYRSDAPVESWLRRILHNLAIDRARRSAREILVADAEERWRDDAYTVDPAVVAVRAETRAELEDALVHLPFAYRAAVVLHDVEGLTTREIAALAGIGVPAAKQRLRRGRMALVTALAEGGERRAALQGVPLRCWDARRRVSDYLDGELAPADAAALERHLESCPTCPPLYAALVGVRASLSRLRDPDSVVPPTVAERIAEAVEPG